MFRELDRPVKGTVSDLPEVLATRAILPSEWLRIAGTRHVSKARYGPADSSLLLSANSTALSVIVDCHGGCIALVQRKLHGVFRRPPDRLPAHELFPGEFRFIKMLVQTKAFLTLDDHAL